MSRSNRFMWRAVRWSPRTVAWLLGRLERATRRDPDGFADRLARSGVAADRAVIEALPAEERRRFASELAEALRQGTAGAVLDMRLVQAPWGFGVQDVTAPVRLWHGKADDATPVAMGGWLAAMLPNADSYIHEGGGHISTVHDNAGDALAWLTEG